MAGGGATGRDPGFRRGDDVSGRHAGGAGGVCAGAGAGAGRLRARRPPTGGGAGPAGGGDGTDRAGAGAGAAEAGAGGSGRPQGGAERQVRRPGAVPEGRAHPALRRYDAAVLRAGRRTRRARHGRALGTSSGAQAHLLQGGRRQGKEGGHLRPRGTTEGLRICGGGRRRHAAPVADPARAAAAGAPVHGLRDAGAAAGSGAGGHGARRRAGGPCPAGPPVAGIRAEGGGAGAGDPRAGR